MVAECLQDETISKRKHSIEPQAAADRKAVKGVIEGFKVHEETLGLLDPIERLVADELIENGTWILIPK